MSSSPEASVVSTAGPGPLFERTLRTGFDLGGHLLSAGESLVVRRLLGLPPPALALYARLWARRPGLFLVADLAYTEVPDVPEALRWLKEAELVHDGGFASVADQLALWTAPELRSLLQEARQPHRGPRADLVERTAASVDRARWRRPSVGLRHRGLVGRVLALALHGSSDFARLLLDDLGLRVLPRYRPTGGPAPYATRAELLDHEAVRALAFRADPNELAGAALDAALRAPRHTGRLGRALGRMALQGALALERQGRPAEALAAYQALDHTGEARTAAVRRPLALEALGRPLEAVAWCTERMETEHGIDETSLALERTGRRLARAAQRPWRPLRPLVPLVERTLRAELSGGVENAVVAALRDAGRAAWWTEASLWTTLFALLFAEALFAEVPGALPVRGLRAPLDFGTEAFGIARRERVGAIRNHILAGTAETLLTDSLRRRFGEDIAGVDWAWAALPERPLVALCALPGPQLLALMDPFTHEGFAAARGLPDVVALAGTAGGIAGLLPSRLPEGLLLVEVKGPGDALRDGQRIWLDRLQRAGVSAEVWWLRA